MAVRSSAVCAQAQCALTAKPLESLSHPIQSSQLAQVPAFGGSRLDVTASWHAMFTREIRKALSRILLMFRNLRGLRADHGPLL